MRVRRVVIATAAAIAAAVGIVAPAFAVEQVDCSAGNGGVKIHWIDVTGAQRTNCYGDVGTLGITLPRTSSVDPGGNSGWIEYTETDGGTTRRAFDGGQVVQIGGLTVTKVNVS